MAQQIPTELTNYLEKHIIVCYNGFDRAHGISHVRQVIEESLRMAHHYDVNPAMVLTIAAYHDTGLCRGREVHHLASGEILQTDTTLRKWFTEEQIKVMKEAGRMNEASVSQMEGTYYSICTQVEDIKASRTEVENTLCALLGETPHMIERGSIYDWKAPVDFISGIPVSLLGNRPDVKMAEHALAASFYTVNQSRAAFYPSINLSGMAGWTNSGGGMIIDPGKMLLSAVASLTQPIFARGEINAQYKISKAQYQEAEIQFQQTLLNAGAEINTTLAKLQNANNKRNLYEKQVESLERAVESTKLLMQNSSTTYLEVLTAVQTLLSAQLSQITNYNDEIQNTISLYQSLGGGVE